jgi:ubiquinone/menaquinone biosynthesis C-methylase UbiE
MDIELIRLTRDEVRGALSSEGLRAIRGVRCAALDLLPEVVARSALERASGGEDWFWCAPRLFVDEALRLAVGSGAFKAAPNDGVVEIGYGVCEAHAGKGYATLGVSHLVAEAFSGSGTRHVLAETAAGNRASQRVLEKNGFRRVGSRDDPLDGTVSLWRRDRTGSEFVGTQGSQGMDHESVGCYWNENADAWTRLARAGYDTYRNGFNTPAFFEMLPDVVGRHGLDIGCGEGYNTRLLARRGAKVTAVDISEVFIRHAQKAEAEDALGIDYRVASAVDLPFPDEHFDFVVAVMSLMDIPETEDVIAEAYRVLAPGGFFQFSISHPCFDTPHRRHVRDATDRVVAMEVGGYFHGVDGAIEEWIFSAAPDEVASRFDKFKTPRFTRTLSRWLNLLLDAGFVLERFGEPYPSDKVVAEHPNLQDAQVIPYFLHIRSRKSTGRSR